MLATGVAGGYGTFSNISHAYGAGTAAGAVAAGEGATAVLALVLLGLTMLGQSSPFIVRAGLWALPAAASAMATMAAPDPGRTVIYALTPMGMSVSAEGMAFLARRIVVHTDGRDAESERRAADLVQALAYHRARATHHPSDRIKKWSERKSWRLARKVGVGDTALGSRLLDVQRDRITDGADAALAAMFGTAVPSLPAAEPMPHPTEGVPDGTPEVTADASARPGPSSEAEAVSPLVICGDRRVWPLAVPSSDTEEEVTGGPGERLPTEAAANVIRACWVTGTPVTETARQATRSTSYVKKVFARLEDERGPQPSPGQLSLVPSGTSA
ncbi:conjugal transfer protein [Streptomyces hebeiensis]